MTGIVCIDEKAGMLFNKRRQSSDRFLVKDVVHTVKPHQLYLSRFSAPLFENTGIRIKISENFLEEAGRYDYCFVEDRRLEPYRSKIDSLIVYRWNRLYPSDFQLDLSLDDPSWNLQSSNDFQGYSHEKITKDVYTK